VLKEDRPVSRVATFCVPRIPKQLAVGNCEKHVVDVVRYCSKNSIKVAGAWSFPLKVPYLLCRLLLCYCNCWITAPLQMTRFAVPYVTE
jgi:hypothetical protein